MPSIPELAERLSENLPVLLAGRDLTANQLDRLACLPPGFTDRLIANDPSAYPCPRQTHRIALILNITVGELFTE